GTAGEVPGCSVSCSRCCRPDLGRLWDLYAAGARIVAEPAPQRGDSGRPSSPTRTGTRSPSAERDRLRTCVIPGPQASLRRPSWTGSDPGITGDRLVFAGTTPAFHEAVGNESTWC